MRACRVAVALCCAVALASAQYGPPRKHKKPHAPLPPVEEQAPAAFPPPEPQPQPSIGYVSSTAPPPDNSIEPGKDYWWMAGGASIFSQPGPAPPVPLPPQPSQGCGGGASGGCGGGGSGGCGGGGGGCGGGSTGGAYPNNPFLSGGANPGPAPSPQFVTCNQPGHVCVPKDLCRGGIVVQDGRGLFDLRSGQCEVSTQACCYKPAPQQSQPGCTGQNGQFVCGGLGPEGSAPTPSPSTPDLVHIAPSSPTRRPGGGYGAPARPAQPGLVHINPGQPGTPGIVHIEPGRPAEPGLVHITPGTPGTTSSLTITSGVASQPGSAIYTPGQPAVPGSVSYTPGQPAVPGSVSYTPGQPAVPGSVSYTPGQPARPGSVTYTAGVGGVPIGGSIYDQTTARAAYSSTTPRAYTGPLNTTPYPGCAAALKCVPEQMCTVDGVMSDRPVVLTKEQYELRVPLSECSDLETGLVGKCCRDPNYKDPWPGGMMGPFVENCGIGAACVHDYECGEGNKIMPINTCNPGDGSTGLCCRNGGSYLISTAGSAPRPSSTPKPGAGYYGPSKPISQPSFSNQLPQPSPSSPSVVALKPPAPGQPGAVNFQPGRPAQPGSVSYTPGVPAQPGSVTYTPGAPAQPGSVTYTPGVPAQPGSLTHTPGAPAQPGSVAYTPGSPAQPGSVSYNPGAPAQPGGVSYTPGSPAQPGGISYTPGSPAQPGSVTYNPGTPAQPGSVSYTPGIPAQPGSATFVTGSASTPATVLIQPGSPGHSTGVKQPARRPGGGYGPPSNPGSQSQASTQAPITINPNNPGGPSCGLQGPIVQQGQTETEAGYSELPWQALILVRGNGSALCSGALISPRAVVTSAQCLSGARASDLLVRVGVWRLLVPAPAGAPEALVAAVARHPERNEGSLAHDVAILILATEVRTNEHVNPICLPPSGQDASYQRNCIASGYAKTALQSGQQGSPLNRIPVGFVPQAQCEETLRQTHLGKYFILHRSFQCAVPKAHNFCLIDAGGPIACDRGDGRYLLAGVYSWDVGCQSTSNPAVLGGIDVTWIQSILNKPVKELQQVEEDEFRQQELLGQSSNTDTKPGFSQGYGRK